MPIPVEFSVDYLADAAFDRELSEKLADCPRAKAAKVMDAALKPQITNDFGSRGFWGLHAKVVSRDYRVCSGVEVRRRTARISAA